MPIAGLGVNVVVVALSVVRPTAATGSLFENLVCAE
jgi:hypothetical protein